MFALRKKKLKGKRFDNALECVRMATVINAVQCIPSLEEIPTTNVIETDFVKKETAPVQTRVETERKYPGRIGMKEIRGKTVLGVFFYAQWPTLHRAKPGWLTFMFVFKQKNPSLLEGMWYLFFLGGGQKCKLPRSLYQLRQKTLKKMKIMTPAFV